MSVASCPVDGSGATNLRVERGAPLPFGATATGRGINFAIFSQHAEAANLVLFRSGERLPFAEIPLDPLRNRTGNVWHILISGLTPNVRYGWRIAGPYLPAKGHRFDSRFILIDPYAKALSGGARWGQPEIRRAADLAEGEDPFPRRCCLPNDDDFDWEGDAPLRTPMTETIIYELHVRGYTVHPSSGVSHPGSFLGLSEKISYLRDLGITAVEMMPVFEFDENENQRRYPPTGEPLRNFWGYSPICFFAPKCSYAANPYDGGQVREFKEMVKRFHAAGIEVFLDVVFNHTAEGDERGPTISFRGIDNAIYYLLTKDGRYHNFSGCGNTLNCNHPLIREMIIDCLRYWVAEMHVDGFRFDLASILGRGPDGEILANPPLLERIANDAVLADTKIIAEAWDAAGLNQVGRFPAFGRWAEWNGFYRDDVRLFWKGQKGLVSRFASRLCGSDDLYKASGRRPTHSINFITSHDGFTLLDLVSYERKHNEDNGEENRDGETHNHSQNFGVEGPTQDARINRERKKQRKNFLTTLFLSQGVPMLLAGDELGRTQRGNNNAYCQDNEISWLDWHLAEENADFLRFVRLLIAFRKRHPALRRSHFFEGGTDISWHGERVGQPDWSENARHLAFLIDGAKAADGRDCYIFAMINANEDWRHFEIPHVGREWRRAIDTSRESPDDIAEDETQAPAIGFHHSRYGIEGRSVVVLVAR